MPKHCENHVSTVTLIAILVVALVTQTHAFEPLKCCAGDNIFDNLCVVQTIDNRTKSDDILLHCENGKYLIDPSLDAEEAFEVNAKGELELVAIDIIYPQGLYCLTNIKENETLRQVAMACFGDEPIPAWAMHEAQGVLVFISVFFICLTLFVYTLLPDLRETQDKATCITLSCLAIFLFFLGLVKVITDLSSNHAICVGSAFIIYFFSLAYFSWLNIVMLNVWKVTVVPQWQIKERVWYLINHLYAWTLPVVMTGITLNNHMIRPTFGLNSCWFSTFSEQWTYLYIPISVLLCINLVLIVWISFVLHIHGHDLSPDRRKVLKYKCMLYLKLFLLGGLTWIFEVLSFHYGKTEDNNWFWTCTDFINCLHGVLIFFVLIVWRKRVRRELGGRKICCFTMPIRWQQIVDDECEELYDNGGATKYDLIIK